MFGMSNKQITARDFRPHTTIIGQHADNIFNSSIIIIWCLFWFHVIKTECFLPSKLAYLLIFYPYAIIIFQYLFHFLHIKNEYLMFFFMNFLINFLIAVIVQILETAFKKETVGLVTREQYVEKVFIFLWPFYSFFGVS